MRGAIRLGSIAGIEIFADWSLLGIFLLIVFSLAAGVFPSWHPDWQPALALVTALGAALLFFASVLAHELSHALVGRLGGIRVRRITLFMLGGMAHLEREPPTWRAELAMAAVGPLTSLALGFLFCAMTFAWLTVYAVAVARLGRLLTGSVRRALDAVTGVVLLALGLRLATEDR